MADYTEYAWVQRFDESGGRIRYEVHCHGGIVATVYEPDRDFGHPLVTWTASKVAEACAAAIEPLLREAKGGRRHG